MNYTIDTIKKTRNFLLHLTNGLSIEQLNEIPAGFNNNIIWNLAHLIAALQMICYVRSGIELPDNRYINTFKSGTKPERFINTDETAAIKQMLFTSLVQLETDYTNQLFVNYEPLSTRYAVEIKNIDEAIMFLPFHEGLHCGYIMALKRAIKM